MPSAWALEGCGRIADGGLGYVGRHKTRIVAYKPEEAARDGKMDCSHTSLRNRLAAVMASMAVIACSAAAACLVGWRPAVADAAPLAAFGRLPTLEDVGLSPAGTKLAFV